MADDPALKALIELEASLLRDAEAAGEHPEMRTKSSFRDHFEKSDWIDLYGLQAYLNLPD